MKCTTKEEWTYCVTALNGRPFVLVLLLSVERALFSFDLLSFFHYTYKLSTMSSMCPSTCTIIMFLLPCYLPVRCFISHGVAKHTYTWLNIRRTRCLICPSRLSFVFFFPLSLNLACFSAFSILSRFLPPPTP